MTSFITYSLISLASFIISYFWLQKTYETIQTKAIKPFLLSGLSPFFYSLTIAFCLVCILSLNFNDFISNISALQLFTPLLLSGLLIVYPKQWLNIAFCLIASLIAPLESVSNYLPELNIYIKKLILFIFMIIFSFSHQRQSALFSGISYLNLATLGGFFVAAFALSSAPKIFGIGGLILAPACCAMFYFNKSPAKIYSNISDNIFFGFFAANIIVFASAEYLLLPCLIVFAMFFINLIFELLQKLINFSLKNNYNIYFISATKAGINEEDIYSFSIKAHIIMGLFALSPIKMQDQTSAFIASYALGAWLLYRTFNLYQQKASWKNIYKDIKEKAGRKEDDNKPN